MDNCTFPRYKENDIIVHLRNCLLTGNEAKTISKNDLFPNAKLEVLHMIFMRALQNVYGIRLEHFYMIPVTFETPYPQIFEGFLPLGNLFIHMERFFPVCRVHDFHIADIITPKAKRTARFLSGILNFLFFRDSRCDVYLGIESTYKSAVEKEQQLQVSIQKAKTKLEKLDTIPVDQQAEFKELSQDIQELEQKLNQEFRLKTSALQDEIHQKRMETAEKTQKLNELKLVICSLKEEQKQLKSRITESPEELANCKERLKQSLQKNKKDKQEVIEKYEAYRDLLLILSSCQQEVQYYQNKIQTQGANVDKLLNIMAKIRTLEEEKENSESRLKNDKIEEMSLKRLVTGKLEKHAAIELKIKKIREDSEQRQQAIAEHCNKLQEKRGAVCNELTSTHEETKQLKSAIQHLIDKVEKQKLKAQEIYLSLRAGLEKYHENLANIMDSYTSGREKKIATFMRLL